MIETIFLDTGIAFDIRYNGKPIVFPLDLSEIDQKDYNENDEWTNVKILEQLWDMDALEPGENGYILTPESVYELETWEKNALKIPLGRLDISLQEHGIITMPSHKFKYKYLSRGNVQSGMTRRGNIVFKGNKQFLLDNEQWKLIEAIDGFSDNGDNEYRARHFAHVKKLAQKANAKTEKKIDDREFLFVDKVDVGIEKINDQEIRVTPVAEEIEESIQKEVADNLDDVVTVVDGNKNYRVFFEKEAASKGKTIKNVKPITGANVPEFTDNPYRFIPEEIELDEAEFAERVKGLKIHKARAIPFVNIEEGGRSNDWFAVDSGINIETEEDGEDWTINDYSAFREKIEGAISNGDSYVFINDQWVKANQNVLDFLDAQRESEQYVHDGKVSREDARKILDIYDNLEAIEYDETTLEAKEQILNPLMQYSVPEIFNGTLDTYQIEGYNFLRLQKDLRYGSLLADDMGLGKTVQVIALLSHLLEQNEFRPLLLVVPTAIVDNWISELGKFLPNLDDIYLHRGTGRLRNHRVIEKYNMTIVSYETLARDQVILGRIKWSYVICDETQKIKNFNTLAASAVKGMNTNNRIAMTGTPIENNLSELWSIIDFIQPGLLGSHKCFVSSFEKPLKLCPEDEGLKNRLIETIKPVFIRRTKRGILSQELPRKTEVPIRVALSSVQREKYFEIVDIVKSETEKKGQHLAALQRLIQLCSHPCLVSEQMPMTIKDMLNMSPKLEKTMEILADIKKKDEKVIIFTRYRMMQALLRKVIFEIYGVDARIINGENPANRMQEINNFQGKQGFNALILSPKSAGVGLNIVAANHVIHYTREWNPAVENQATDRVYRRGQEKDVYVYYPVVCADDFITVEEKLDLLLSRKRELMEDIIVVNGLDVTGELESIFEQ